MEEPDLLGHLKTFEFPPALLAVNVRSKSVFNSVPRFIPDPSCPPDRFYFSYGVVIKENAKLPVDMAICTYSDGSIEVLDIGGT